MSTTPTSNTPTWNTLSLDESLALRTRRPASPPNSRVSSVRRPSTRFRHSSFDHGLFHRPGGERAVAWSGGSEPGIEVNPAAVAVMAERGIDISGEFPKPLTDETVRAGGRVVTMGCGDACPLFPGKRYEEWILDDPAGWDEIERRVRNLLSSATASGFPQPRDASTASSGSPSVSPGV